MGNPNDPSSEAMRMDDNGAPHAPVQQSVVQPEAAVASEPPKPRFFGENPAVEMMQLTSRILCDQLPLPCLCRDQAVAAYLFALAPADAQGVMERGAELYRDGNVVSLAFLGLGMKYLDKDKKPQYGTPALADDTPPDGSSSVIHSGFRSWMRSLAQLGVPTSDIRINTLNGALYTAKNYSTHTEAVGIVESAAVLDLNLLILVSAPWHLVRATCEVVTQVIRRYPRLRVYATSSRLERSRPWAKAELCSQSTAGVKTPLAELETEGAKLRRYCEEFGDMEPAAAILRYFDNRDAADQQDIEGGIKNFKPCPSPNPPSWNYY